MLSHCANSQCSRPFLRLGQGKLFLVETGLVNDLSEQSAGECRHMRNKPVQVERYWLCDECGEIWTLVQDGKRGIMLVPSPGHPS